MLIFIDQSLILRAKSVPKQKPVLFQGFIVVDKQYKEMNKDKGKQFSQNKRRVFQGK